MTTHFYNECPGMNDGDGVLDTEGLDLENWVYDCQTCKYVERVERKSWAGGFCNGLQEALDRLDEVQTAINLGHSKLQVFRLLMREWSNIEGLPNPEFRPTLIMSDEELLVYRCSDCNVGTSYFHTEDDEDVWRCDRCGREIRIRV